ncbi:hypothetical protein CFC21_075751 [Triticum aestivum]|uniref:Uncharacterized protein n=2 Tax=Triticum aestivum TaxID=4565 RepID=A0A3B6MKG0_WHEAT|nr:hypothetical protein CFC21_075751 [Triticum aestivum]
MSTNTWRLVTEDDGVGDLHERRKGLGRELAREHVGVGPVGLPELPDEVPGDLLRLVGVRVAADGVGPVDPGERVLGAAVGVLHVEQRREVVLLRVARVLLLDEARRLELVPEPPVPDHHDGVPPGEHEELGADAEAVEGHLREHHVVAARVVAGVQRGLAVQDLDEAAVAAVAAGIVVGEEGAVEGGEREERDAGLGEQREELVGRVVEQRGGEEAARGGDERGGGARRGLAPDDAAAEGGGRRQREVGGGVGVDVEVEEAVVPREELLPERREDEVGVGEEEEGHLGPRLRAAAEDAEGGGPRGPPSRRRPGWPGASWASAGAAPGSTPPAWTAAAGTTARTATRTPCPAAALRRKRALEKPKRKSRILAPGKKAKTRITGRSCCSGRAGRISRARTSTPRAWIEQGGKISPAESARAPGGSNGRRAGRTEASSGSVAPNLLLVVLGSDLAVLAGLGCS